MYQRIKDYLDEIIRIKKSPKSIALGAAVGTFISILPTPFMNVMIGLLVILIFKQINKFSLFGSMAVWNPVTLLPIYLASYSIGDMLFASEPIVSIEFTLLEQAFHFTRRFLVGNIILAIVISFLVYFLVYYLSRRWMK